MQNINYLSERKIVSNRCICYINNCVSIHPKHKIVSPNATISLQRVKRFAGCNYTIIQAITICAKRFETHMKRCTHQYLQAFTRFYSKKISFHSNF